jgi:hypothetical protein
MVSKPGELFFFRWMIYDYLDSPIVFFRPLWIPTDIAKSKSFVFKRIAKVISSKNYGYLGGYSMYYSML